MRLFSTFIAAAVLALGVSFASTAQAAHSLAIQNGDAETGDTTGWDNVDSAIGAVGASGSGNITVDGAGDSNFFSTSEDSVTDGGSAMMDQTVNVWGCGVEHLQGTYALTGIFATGTASGGDTAQVTVKFFNNIGNLIQTVSTADLETAVAGDWAAITGLGTTFVPEGAATMNVKITGTDAGTTDSLADVGFDNLDANLTDCLKDFAKISGKIGARRGQWSFEGSVGHLHDGGMELVGSISINYKDLHQLCVFTPTDLTYPNADDTTALVEADYNCNEGDLTGTAVLRLIAATGGHPKDRGSICVDAEADDQLDIQDGFGTDSLCDEDDDTVDLRNGNVHVDNDTSD